MFNSIFIHSVYIVNANVILKIVSQQTFECFIKIHREIRINQLVSEDSKKKNSILNHHHRTQQSFAIRCWTKTSPICDFSYSVIVKLNGLLNVVKSVSRRKQLNSIANKEFVRPLISSITSIYVPKHKIIQYAKLHRPKSRPFQFGKEFEYTCTPHPIQHRFQLIFIINLVHSTSYVHFSSIASSN